MTYFILYCLLGFGLRGGFAYWNDAVRTLYAMAFPIHELFLRGIFSDPVKRIVTSHRFWFWAFVVFLFYMANRD